MNANHFVSSSLEDHFVDTNPPALRGNSFHRYERVKSDLEDSYGRIDVALAKRLMAQHGGPLDSLCRHTELGGRSTTISATIFLPAARSFWACFGSPCQGGYRLFSVKEGAE